MCSLWTFEISAMYDFVRLSLSDFEEYTGTARQALFLAFIFSDVSVCCIKNVIYDSAHLMESAH